MRKLVVLAVVAALAACSSPLAPETVYRTKTGAKYHAGTCRMLKKSKIAIERSEAQAKGLEACKICKP